MEDKENIENSITGFGSSQEKRIVKENSQQPEYDDPASNLGDLEKLEIIMCYKVEYEKFNSDDQFYEIVATNFMISQETAKSIGYKKDLSKAIRAKRKSLCEICKKDIKIVPNLQP